MTLDDLIEQLVTIRRNCPAAATATVVGFQIEHPHYSRVEVRLKTTVNEVGDTVPEPQQATVLKCQDLIAQIQVEAEDIEGDEDTTQGAANIIDCCHKLVSALLEVCDDGMRIKVVGE